jgi:hypothetical protein
VELGVHPVIGGGPMPVYIRRPHDESYCWPSWIRQYQLAA